MPFQAVSECVRREDVQKILMKREMRHYNYMHFYCPHMLHAYTRRIGFYSMSYAKNTIEIAKVMSFRKNNIREDKKKMLELYHNYLSINCVHTRVFPG